MRSLSPLGEIPYPPPIYKDNLNKQSLSQNFLKTPKPTNKYPLTMDNDLKRKIARRISDYEKPKRIALSKKYPLLKKPVIVLRRTIRNIQNFFDFKIRYERKNVFFNHIVARPPISITTQTWK